VTNRLSLGCGGVRSPGQTAARAVVPLLAVCAACGSSESGGRADLTTPTAITADATDTTETAGAPATGAARLDQRYPDVVDAMARRSTDGTYRFEVTISSPYDTPERYADAWRVLGPDGTVYGVRELTHDHAGEQPFTRSLDGVVVPPDVDVVTIEGRDLANGWGGGTARVDLTASGSPPGTG